MEIIKETFLNFGFVEWFMFAIIAVLIATVFLFYKGSLIAKNKLDTYEKELRECRKDNESLKATNKRLLETFEERSDN